MKRIIIGWERNTKKRVYLVQRRKWFFWWVTIGIYDKQNKALNRYLA